MGFYRDQVAPHLINLAMRNSHFMPYRRRLVAKARGRVLEIGVGSGMNLPLYTNLAREIVGLDPHPKLLAMAVQKTARVPFRIVEGSAESIPLDDRSADTVVMTWTLCSIPNAIMALQEIRRVLKPTGEFLFVEHGLSPDEGVRRWQHRLTPWWKSIAGGCHLDRPIAELVEAAGFQLRGIEMGYMRGPKPLTFMYEGTALPC